MPDDYSMFFGRGGFGGINRTRPVKTVYVPIAASNNIQSSKESPAKTALPVYKEVKKRRKRKAKKRTAATASKNKPIRKSKRAKKPKASAKKSKIQKFSNF